jgi:hypothetical protein
MLPAHEKLAYFFVAGKSPSGHLLIYNKRTLICPAVNGKVFFQSNTALYKI